MRFVLALFAFGLLLLGLSGPSAAMPVHDPVAAEPTGVTINGDNWARDKYAAAAAAADRSAPIPIGDNWARDKYAASAAADTAASEPPVTAPLTDSSTPWALYIGISVALIIGAGALLSSRVPRFHMPHGA